MLPSCGGGGTARCVQTRSGYPSFTHWVTLWLPPLDAADATAVNVGVRSEAAVAGAAAWRWGAWILWPLSTHHVEEPLSCALGGAAPFTPPPWGARAPVSAAAMFRAVTAASPVWVIVCV